MVTLQAGKMEMQEVQAVVWLQAGLTWVTLLGQRAVQETMMRRGAVQMGLLTLQEMQEMWAMLLMLQAGLIM